MFWIKVIWEIKPENLREAYQLVKELVNLLESGKADISSVWPGEDYETINDFYRHVANTLIVKIADDEPNQ